jgi:hypothetical protein
VRTRSVSGLGWTVALWIAWLFILAVSVFGAAVRVEFVEPAVPFSRAWDSIALGEGWRGALQWETVLVWGASLLCVLVHSFSRAWKVRLGVMVAGFLIPALVETPLMLYVMVVSSLMIFQMFLGTPDREFYEEGWPMFAACGLWMMEDREGFGETCEPRILGGLRELQHSPVE